jgi:TatA/E family protein of Tat protein translocase
MQHPFFAFGLPHGADWLYVMIIVVVLFGANKLPQLARGIGRSLGEFKKAKEDFEKEVHAATSETDAKKLEEGKTPAAPATTSSVAELSKKN